MPRLRLPLTSRLAAVVGIGLVAALPASGVAAGEALPQPAGFAESRVVTTKLVVATKPVVTKLDQLRKKVARALADGLEAEALAPLEALIAALVEQREALFKDQQQEPSSLLQIEKIKRELSRAHLNYGEISRRLSHNRRLEPVKRLDFSPQLFESGTTRLGKLEMAEVLADLLGPNVRPSGQQGTSNVTLVDAAILKQLDAVRLSDNSRQLPREFFFRTSEATPFDEVAIAEDEVKAVLKQGRDASALRALEDFAAALRRRRDALAESHGQQADRLAELTRTQDALGRAHLDSGLLGQVLDARREVTRLLAETAAGRATQADLAAARAGLAAAEARLAAEGNLFGR